MESVRDVINRLREGEAARMRIEMDARSPLLFLVLGDLSILLSAIFLGWLVAGALSSQILGALSIWPIAFLLAHGHRQAALRRLQTLKSGEVREREVS